MDSISQKERGTAMEEKKNHLISGSISRRTFLKVAGTGGIAAALGPQILIPQARGAKKDQVVFVSEESNPKAIAVYEKINADFSRNTGIKVVMEYPGFANIHKRVATLIAAGTPPEIVWYGAGQAMNLALENQLADVGDVIKEVGGIPDDLRMIFKGADRSIPTSQQFTYGWYRKDLYQQKGLQPMKSWEDFIHIAKTLNNPPNMYGCIIPSAETGASTILLETALMTNNVHWFEYNAAKKDYEVALDKGDNKKRAVETLEFLHELHKYSPEASTYNWAELMSTFVAEKAANSYYVGARLLEQVMANNARIADATAPVAFPKRLTDHFFLSIQGFHILTQSNVEGAKQYVKFFLKHPDCIQWYHAVPLHIIPASREVLRSAKYQDHPVIQKRKDVLNFLDSVWGKGVPLYYWDGKELNPYIGLYHNDNLSGWMVAMRNIKKAKPEAIVEEAANKIRGKMKRVG
jgi:ABC-type glycerol-3-phosphate transport system substrate-binding protein